MTLPDFLIDHSNGEIRLAGHRIGLYDVINLYQQGYSADRIRDEYPTLSRETIDKVITFYRANQTDVDSYVALYRADLDRQEAAHAPNAGAGRVRQIADILRKADAKSAGDPTWARLSIAEKIERLGLLDSSKTD